MIGFSRVAYLRQNNDRKPVIFNGFECQKRSINERKIPRIIKVSWTVRHSPVSQEEVSIKNGEQGAIFTLYVCERELECLVLDFVSTPAFEADIDIALSRANWVRVSVKVK